MEVLDTLMTDEKGLFPAIAQDAETGEVLMLAYMNRESLGRTLAQGVACYWSRSRQEFWVKGQSSGHLQEIVSVHLDCDGDAVLLRVRQKGGACHTGHYSCFFRRVETNGALREEGEKVFAPKEVYGTEP